MKKKEKKRYSRQIFLFGKDKQKSLKNKTVLVIGAGGLGSGVLPYLVASGVGKIIIYDFDTVDVSNLGRQVLFNEKDIHKSKAKVAKKKLKVLNPYVDIRVYKKQFTEKIFRKKYTSDLKVKKKKYRKNHSSKERNKIQSIDLIFEGTDSIQNKFLISDLAKKYNVPAIIGAVGSTYGQVFPIDSKNHLNAPCYRCIFEKPPENENVLEKGSVDGIVSPLPGVIGSMMAYLGVLYLVENTMPSKLFLLDKAQWRTIKLNQNKSCICNIHPPIT